MELWEFNMFMLGRAEKYKREYKQSIITAYYTAGFVWSKDNKSLAYYLDQIDKADNRSSNNKEKIAFAKKMCSRIERLSDGKKHKN